MGFSMKGPSMSISYGGETNKQQKSNLMKDNPVAKHASAMHMAGKKAVAYQQDQETPLEVTEEGAKKIAASDANPAFKKAIAKASALLNKNKIKKVARKAIKAQKLKSEAQEIEGQHGYGSNKKSERKNKRADRKKAKVTKAYKSLSDEDKQSANEEYQKRKS